MADEVALLLRRLGFGPTPVELTAATQAGYAATGNRLTKPSGADPSAALAPVPQLGPDPSPRLGYLTAKERAVVDVKRGEQIRTLTRWWLDRMTVAQHQGYEKMVFFRH